MALSKIFKKTSAPDELPDLAINELKKDLKKDYSEKEVDEKIENPEEKIEETPKENANPEEKEEEVENKEESEEEIPEEAPIETDNKKDKKEKTEEEKANLEKSFFNPFLKELKKENFDPAKINAWYQQRFAEKSAIEEMKEYWEKQKDKFITESVEKEFKERINKRMDYLQELEAGWQEIYLNLIKKEEEMKKEEKEIKKIIKEFSEVVKQKGNLKKEHKIK
jgi:hypothetical protein